MSYSRTVLLHFDVLLSPVQTSISSMFSLCIPYLAFHALRDWFFILSVDLPTWVRVEESLVRFSERSNMDQRVVIVDQFTAAMASIQEALASLRQKIDSQ